MLRLSPILLLILTACSAPTEATGAVTLPLDEAHKTEEKAPTFEVWRVGYLTEAVIVDCGAGHTAIRVVCDEGRGYIDGQYGVCVMPKSQGTVFEQAVCTW